MSLVFAIAVYLICWWMVLFIVLPFGVRSQQEVGDVVEGSEPAAPSVPNIWRKFVITTLIAAVVFAPIYLIIEFKLIPLDSIPFLPRYPAPQ
jgi:predicted secreted protein